MRSEIAGSGGTDRMTGDVTTGQARDFHRAAMDLIDPAYAEVRLCTPHTWHAALLERKE